jgi:DNA-binding winged helix-turn-helix (wHTH) protein
VIEAVEGEEALAFGRFELRSDGSLLRGGEFVPLTPKEAGVLVVLCEAGGRIVRKDEIVSRVWGDYPASDASLSRCIHTLRRRLGSVGDGCIATVYGRGYRVTVPVERVVRPRALSPIRRRDDVPSRAEFAGRQRPDVSSLKNANTT